MPGVDFSCREGNTCQPVSVGYDVCAAVDFWPFDDEKCGTAESLTHASAFLIFNSNELVMMLTKDKWSCTHSPAP